MRRIFDALDLDHSGCLSANELFDPLFCLGLVNDRSEVESMVYKIDPSGLLEFPEFLQMIKENRRQG